MSTGGNFGENFFLREMVGGGMIFCLGLLWSRVVLFLCLIRLIFGTSF